MNPHGIYTVVTAGFPAGKMHPQGKGSAAAGNRNILAGGGDTVLYEAPMAAELNPTPQGWCICYIIGYCW